MTKKRRWIIITLVALIVLIAAALIAGRLYLPTYVKEHLNAELDNIKGYDGSIGDIDIHLYRGAYTIHKLQIRKTGSGMPVPFVDIETMDLSVEWKALFHGRVVAEIEVEKPILNFAVNRSGTDFQTGGGVDWSEKVKKLMPIDINRVSINRGRLAYRNFSTNPQVDIFIHNIEGKVTNLRNVVDKDAPLPSTITVTGNSIGGGKFGLKGKMNILKTIPDLDIDAKLERVDLTALNNYFRAFAALDVESGSFDAYTEIKVKDGHVSGYVKPIARDISLIDLKRDANPVKLLWESIASVVIEIFTNHRKDQFATEIPLEGNIGNIKTDKWEALVGIVRNAFVKAVEKGFGKS